MNPTAASLAAGTRLLERCALLFVCLANPARSLGVLLLICVASPAWMDAQTTADRESIRSVVDLLFLNADPELSGDAVARHPGIWSVVIARFAKGDSREIDIPAKVGEWYQVDGASDSDGTDVDICIFGPEGDQIDCDTYDDNFPIVGFIAETDGVYRAVMTAASVDGRETSFAGMVVFRVSDEEESRRTRETMWGIWGCPPSRRGPDLWAPAALTILSAASIFQPAAATRPPRNRTALKAT